MREDPRRASDSLLPSGLRKGRSVAAVPDRRMNRGGIRGRIETEDIDLFAVGREKARDQANERRLARAIRTHEARDRSGRDDARHGVECGSPLSKSFREPLEPNESVCHGPDPSVWIRTVTGIPCCNPANGSSTMIRRR